MTVLLAPATRAPATRVGARTFRKQILKAGDLDYRQPDGTVRRLHFDDQYFTDLAKAFNDGAYESVKAVMADDANRHTMDPERMRGDVVDLVPSQDGSGLDAIVRLSEGTAQLVQDNPDLGVSARIVEGLQRGDGRSWPRALQHVLLTTDPRMTGLRQWEQVNLAAEAGHDVIDLSAAQTGERSGDMTRPGESGGLSDADIERIVDGLQARLNGSHDEGDGAGDDGGDPWERINQLSDEDLEEFFDDDDGDDEGGVPAGVGAGGGAELSNPAGGGQDPAVVELSQQNAALNQQLQSVHVELAQSRWQSERSQLEQLGVPPALLNLASPVLQADHQGQVIDLSNGAGGQVNPAQVLRQVLRGAAGIVDLSAEQGHTMTPPIDDDDTTAAHKAWEAQYGGSQ